MENSKKYRAKLVLHAAADPDVTVLENTLETGDIVWTRTGVGKNQGVGIFTPFTATRTFFHFVKDSVIALLGGDVAVKLVDSSTVEIDSYSSLNILADVDGATIDLEIVV